MITIVHGENLVKSREKLFQLKQLAKNNNQELTSLLAKQINFPTLEKALYAHDLFGQQHCLIIEELHSLAHSKIRNKYIEQIQKAGQNLDIILWEKKSLSKSNLQKFPRAQVFTYPMGKALWDFLDALQPRASSKKQLLLALNEAVEQDSAELCFIMISKRIGDLLALKLGSEMNMHPFVKNKLKQQQLLFTQAQLLNAHQQLYQLDKKLKRSQNLLSLRSELDLLLINL